MANSQRKNSSSNTQVGSDFESIALRLLSKEMPTLKKNFPLKIGINDQKTHKFDLGSENCSESNNRYLRY